MPSIETFPDAVVILETLSSPIDDRLNALRFFQQFVESGQEISNFTDKIKINQLVLDNVMFILHREDSIPDLRRRQLIRAECFLMLARVLESKSLFGGTAVEQSEAAARLDTTTREKRKQAKKESYLNSTVHDPTKDLYHSMAHPKDPLKVGKYNIFNLKKGAKPSTSHDDAAANVKESNISQDDNHGDNDSIRSSVSAGSLLPKKNQTSMFSAAIAKSPNKYNLQKASGQKSKLPRQTVISGATLDRESVSFQGVSPYDTAATDKRIGYQKSRLWVPHAGSDIHHELLPQPRPQGYKELQAQRITEDFLKMRALMSYVGDTVLPFSFKGDKAVGSYITRKTPMLASSTAYSDAIREAVQLWSPLFGATLPLWASSRKNDPSFSSSSGSVSSHAGPAAQELTRKIAEAVAATSHPPPAPPRNTVAVTKTLSSKVQTLKSVVRNEQISEKQKRMAVEGAEAVLVTKGALRRLLRNELVLKEKSKQTYRQSLDLISRSGRSSVGVTPSEVGRLQRDIYVNLEAEKLATSASCAAMGSLLLDTVKVQYASLPSRYLLVVDRGQAASRASFEKAMITFGNRKRLNFLALAVGIWKICLIEDESLQKRPKYAKYAALILLGDWATNRKVRKIKEWFARWKITISKSIFLERYRAVLPIQCLYRVWRDQTKFKKMHLAGPYNGPLSDIYLAPSRGKAVKFSIPRMIRASRRMYWQAAILIQTHYRRFILRKEYYIKLRKVLLVQSIMRMFPKYIYYRRLKAATIRAQAYGRRTVKRNWFKKLKYCTVIAQKYVRRYLGILQRIRMEDVYWTGLEESMSPIIRLQCRWRIHMAKKECAARRYRKERLQWAALQLQRTWYRKQNAFHTFMLMCAYREIERQDAELESLSERMGRNCCSRVIQKYYREHYYIRIIRSAIAIQCWYRGRKGKESVNKMRLVTWASRKLHHWAKAMMKFKHTCSRKIAFAWWRAVPGRYRMHMHHRIRTTDMAQQKKRRAVEALAAARIQAIVLGKKARAHVRYLRAAIKIQRPARFYAARLLWKKQIYEKQHGWLIRIVNKIFGTAVDHAAHYICLRQNSTARHVQAMVRGFLCRRSIFHARCAARTMGIAVIRLQRFWRSSDSFMKAVQEVMALRRLENNPYRTCGTVHAVMLSLRGDTAKYYHFKDPRVGQLTTSLLQRAGLLDLQPVFAKEDKYKYASSLRTLTVQGMIAVSERWLKREDKKFKAKNMKPPKFSPAQFQELAGYMRAPLQPTKPVDQASLKGIQSIQEVMNRDDFVQKFSESFIKRYGNQFASRAENLSTSFGDEFWSKFNNFKTMGSVLTEAVVARALEVCKTPAEVKPVISKLAYPKKPEVGMAGKVHPHVLAQQKWDLERLKLCADCCQSATERAMVLLPEGPIRDLLAEVGIACSAYRRRFSRQIVTMQKKVAEDKLKKLQNAEGAAKAAAAAAKAKAKAEAKAKATERKKNSKKSTSNNSTPKKKNPFESYVAPESEAEQETAEADGGGGGVVTSSGISVCSVQESIEIKFLGTLEDAEMELMVNICKLYMNAHEKLFIATKGVNSIKNHWYNSALARSIREEKRKNFLAKSTAAYVEQRHANHVRDVWVKLRKQEGIKWREEAIMQSVLERTQWIQSNLDYLVRYGWTSYMDDYGYTYYHNDNSPDDATYEMPKYTLAEWRSVTKVQWAVGRFLEKIRELRRLKDIEKAIAIANHERLQADMLAKSKQCVTASLSIVRNSIRRLGAYKARDHKQTDHSPEIFLPFRYRFTEDRLYKPQEWVLMRFDEDPPRYVSGLVLKFSKSKLSYNIRLVAGTIVKNVDPKRIFKINYDKGSLVEARYKGDLVFYRGKISNVRKTADKLETVYSIKYDDGEFEEKVSVNYIRPSPAGVLAFLKERNRLLHFYKKREQRSTYYAGVRAARLEHTASVIQRCESDFLRSWKDATGRSLKRRSLPGESVLGMIQAAATLKGFNIGSRIRVFYTKACLRFEWFEVKTGERNEKGDEIVTYKNYVTDEEADKPPMYTSAEHFGVLKIHSAWSVYKARKNLKRLLLQQSLLSIATMAIRQYQKFAYIGYKNEGVTVIQYLRRAGYLEVANSMALFFATRPSQYAALTLESFLALPKDKLKTVGLNKHSEVQDFIRFRDFWKNSSPAVRDSHLAFLNSYESMSDTRPMRKCIQAGEYLIRPKITRAYKNSESRIKHLMNGIMKSNMPITKMQLDSFLDEFAGKAGLAQEKLGMLVDQPVLPTYVEELEAFNILKETTRRIIYMLKSMKIKSLKKHFDAALKRAMDMTEAEKAKHEGRERPLMSAAEGRAALILRVEVIDSVLQAEKAVGLLQRRVRGITKRLWFLRTRKTREQAAIKLQSFIRCRAAKLLADELRAQKSSNWEQLWDDNRRCIYYFNKFTNTASYDDPLIPCRPLVRDLRSSALIQAWPDLEGNATGYDFSATGLVVVKSQARIAEENAQNVSEVCSVCKERATKRICQDCNQHRGASYCFTCFSSTHSNDPDRINHIYKDLIDKPVQVLICCECEEPATRKCMGVLDEREIDALCSRLQRAKAATWMQVLREANVGGERKLTMMMDHFSVGAEAETATLSSVQLQQVRTMLERTRAECDECYCDRCYGQLHSGGKRALHRWVGFNANAPVCTVCTRAPAEADCHECGGGIFCKSCFKVFHNKGRKKKHAWTAITEECAAGQDHCSVCTRRAATTSCPDCSIVSCNSCLECVHRHKCPVVLSRAAEVHDPGLGRCVSCQEEADQKCVECGDLYCSRTWMGNAGCFSNYHSRGNRVNHTLEPLDGPESPRLDDSSRLKSKKNKSSKRDSMKNKKDPSSSRFTLPGIKA